MKTKKNFVYLGTSGWTNKDWHDLFYPNDYKGKLLVYLSGVFNSVEVNSSFYRTPNESTFMKWYNETPKDFVFAVKLNRYITHMERLKGVKRQLNYFLKNASVLKEKLGALLVQLPPNFPFNRKLVAHFLNNLNELKNKYSPHLDIALEPRHPSWFESDMEEMRNFFKEHGVAMVFAHSTKYVSFEPIDQNITSSFVYLRLHGPREFAASQYGVQALKEWSELIKKWVNKKLRVYIYFNNDVRGYAALDALDLRKILKKEKLFDVGR